MSFTSPEFFLLLALVVPAYYAAPVRLRNPLLLAASAAFYMSWRPAYILLILFSVSVDYGVALGLGRAAGRGARRLLLGLSLVSNLGLLCVFKYLGFAADSLHALLGTPALPPAWELLLPVGISFYTFQALSYTIDVYRGTIPPERSFPRLCLYVLFFPQLVAGPIERSQSLLPQFSEEHRFDYARAVEGLRLILFGLVKKIFIADRLAAFVEPMYRWPSEHSGLYLLLATYAFAFQIYADFSAYSDIAVGAARLLGFRLMENFRRPYLATSIPDFWRRWHVSLSTWFRDYAYIPLGGNRGGALSPAAALVATFLLSGLWHGAKWTFVAWGAYHAALMLLSRRFPPLPGPAWLKIVLTFHAVLLGWVLFRAGSLADAVQIVARVFLHPFESGSPRPAIDLRPHALGAVGVLTLLLVDLSAERNLRLSRPWPAYARWIAYGVGALILLNGGAQTEVPFIYFQF